MKRRCHHLPLQGQGASQRMQQLSPNHTVVGPRESVEPRITEPPRVPSHASAQPHQLGFTRCRSTMDAILALRLLVVIHREFGRPLHVAYIDIKAAFDSVNREALWKAMKTQGTPPSLLRLIKDLQEGTTSGVRSASGDVSDSILTSSGVRQGCILLTDAGPIALPFKI